MTTPTDNDHTPATEPISVIGLGDMGSAIARALIERGHPTTVWNRTASKADPLVEAGAVAAATPAEAVAASPVTIVCLLDDHAVKEVFATVGDGVADRVLVNVTSGEASQARANEHWATTRRAAYLDGKIMGDPPYIGTENVNLSFSGSPESFARHESTLRELGNVTHHGADAGAAAVEFMAQVAIGYEFLIGFLHTLKLVQAEGVDIEAFSERVGASLAGYPPLLKFFASMISSGEYGPDLGPLAVQAALMDDMINHREAVGVESVRMREVKELMDRRIAQGHGDQGFASLFELLDRE